MSESFRTVAGPGEAAFEIQGSRFIGHVRRVDTVEQAAEWIEKIGEEYADATHVVPAYRVRADPLRAFSSDEGEPAGSAGKPMLNVLDMEGLENVVAVVVRYYGGTKLGVGGLARAYARGVKAALEDAGTETVRPRDRFRIDVEYDDSGTVRGILESSTAAFEASYEETVSFEVRIPEPDSEQFRERVRTATSDRVQIVEMD